MFSQQAILFLLLVALPTVFLQNVDPLGLGIRDLITGTGIPNITCELYKAGASKKHEWLLYDSTVTNERGSVDNIITQEDFELGVYRILFYAKPYYESKNLTTFYPYIEIQFERVNLDEQIIIPVLSSPYGYSTYRGSSG